MKDTFKFIIPAEIQKSEDGDWKIAGLASTEAVDQQGETIIQKGIDLTPIDQNRGYFNFDHLPGPENLIGTIDGYKQTDKGLYVHGKLFKNHDKAKSVYQIMSSLGEGSKGRVGLSVEGKILERDQMNKAVIKKCQISKVAVTFNPVNQETHADIIKSMTSGAAIDFNATKDSYSDEQNTDNTPIFSAEQVVEIVKKALGVGAGYAQAPDTLTGGDALATSDMKPKKKKKDEDEEAKPLAVRKAKLKKSSASDFQKGLTNILDSLQTLYPENSRSQLWEALKDRLTTKYPEISNSYISSTNEEVD